MGEKVEEKKAAKAEGGEKKGDAPIDVVLKLDLHCEGCAKKVKRAVSKFEGVEKVMADFAANKMIVTGSVDPAQLREMVESKTKKEVELISPQPKKDAGGEKKAEKKAEEKKPEKPKEAVVATVVLKTELHCQGCAHKIKRTVLKNVEGVESVVTDLEKNSVTVTGTMDVKGLVSFLQEKIKKSVEVVPPPKKDGGGEKEEKKEETKKEEKKEEKKDGSAGEKKEEKKDGAGEKKEKKEEGKKESGGGEKKGDKKEGGGGGEKKQAPGDKKAAGEGGEPKMEFSKMEYSGYSPYMQSYAVPMFNQSYPSSSYVVQYAPPPPPPPTYLQADHDHGYFNQNYHPGYFNRGYPVPVHGPPPPQPAYMGSLDGRMFSDENPQGCSVM